MDLYTPLMDYQIRLLKVLPKGSNDEESIQCSLDVVSLSSKPGYCALSYTWGPAIGPSHIPRLTDQSHNSGVDAATDQTLETGTILIDGQIVTVRRNLWTFLDLCARQSNVTSSGMQTKVNAQLQGLIWVDALCINQDDLAERGSQISIMNLIYQSAQKVLVWLGDADEFTTDAFDLIVELDKMGSIEARQLRPRDVVASPDRTTTSLRHWTALGQLFHRNWFQRSWIWQEVIFAQDAVVLCGYASIRWKSLAEVSGLIATSGWKLYLSSLYVGPEGSVNYDEWYSIPARIRASKKDFQFGTEPNLLYALVRARHTLCSDPRDKVYALIHLGKASIKPDYTLNTREVYIQAAEYILEHRDDLYLLACCEGQDFHRLPGLPSWVPDWTTGEVLGLGITGYKDFLAASYRPRMYYIREIEGRKVLSVEAAELDVIDAICGSKTELRETAELIKLLCMIAEMSLDYRDGERRDEALWRVLTTNRSNLNGNNQHPAHTDVGKSFRSWVIWRLFENGGDLNGLMTMLETIPAGAFDDQESFIPSPAVIIKTLARCRGNSGFAEALEHDAACFELHYSHAMNLRPFRTRKGYLGIGTTSLRPGDYVGIVSGSRVPLIFRPATDDRVALVGGALVHGFMRGGFLNSNEAKFCMIDIE